MPTDATRRPARRALAWAITATMAGLAVPALAAAQEVAEAPTTIPARQEAPFEPCPLGTFSCPPRPVSYALCRPNALLAFYRPDLPHDADGREQAVTDVHAEHSDAADRAIYHLDGNVSLQRYDQLLQADHIDYNDRTTAYDARGSVTWQDSAALLSASRIHGTTRPDHSQASDVRYQMLASRGNGTAAHAEMRDADHHDFSQATYSTCDPGHRTWEFRAKSIRTDKVTGTGVARGATMRLWDVPFLYLPYMSFPIDDRRKSGFLYPTFANNGNSGFMLSVPYYLNLAPNYDATLTPQLYTERGLMLGGQFRYLFGGTRGELDVDYLPNDHRAGSDRNHRDRDIDDGADRYLLQFKNRSRISDDWSFSTSIKRASDKYYFQDFQSDLKGYTTPSSLHSNGYLRGYGDWWTASLGADDYQNVDPIYDDSHVQYKRWPRATFNIDMPLSRHVTFGMDNEAVAFRKDDSVEGNRLDMQPWVQADFQGPAWYVRPRMAWRYTGYELVDDPDHYGYTNHSPSRSLPIASIDSGLVFERDTSLFGHAYKQTLEPRLYYLYVPYRDQRDQPIFDTRSMQFAWWQLFSPNRFSGADRQMDANNLTAALTSRLLDTSGVEKAAFSVGQIRYFSPQRVQLNRRSHGTDFDGSDYVAQMSLSLSPTWRLNSVYQWDPNDRRTSVGTLQVQRRLGPRGLVNFAYRYRLNYMEQFDASAIVPINERWRLLGRWNVQLRDNTHWERGQPKTLAALFGVEYDSCCVAVRLMGRHYVRNVHGDTDNAVMLQVQFKGLGSFSPQTEDFLRHAILGYQ